MSGYNKSLLIFITTQFKEKDYFIIWFDYTVLIVLCILVPQDDI